MSSSFSYRADIDGLRSVAVLSVVVFHLGFQQLEGGFLGVDIFFVISGFLITSIISRKMQKGTFRFGDFYLGRIRRLVPPLIGAVLFTFIASLFVLQPADFIAFCYSAITSLLSTSNILFYLEAGYWDQSSELKPLLHTWSLGVEEQFYLFWPALVLGVVTFMRGKWASAAAFAAISLLGVLASQWMLANDPSAAFFLLPARIFEFAIGAAGAHFSTTSVWRAGVPRILKDGVSVASLAALVALFFLYDGQTPFPGTNGLAPSLLTVMILIGGEDDRGVGVATKALLANPVALWIGRVSYSMYLVHWPIVALMRYQSGEHLSLAQQGVAAALTLVFTIILHYFIERRFSARAGMLGESLKPRLSPPAFALGAVSTAYLMTLVSGHAITNEGWRWRMPSASVSADEISAAMAKRYSVQKFACQTSDYFTSPACSKDRPIKVLMFGNSHENDGFNMINTIYGQDKDVLIVSYNQWNGCELDFASRPPTYKTDERCGARSAGLVDPNLIRDMDVLVYSANTPFASNKQVARDAMIYFREINPDLAIITLGGYINTTIECAKIINRHGSAQYCVDPEYVKVFPIDESADGFYDDIMAMTDLFINRIELLCSGETAQTCQYQSQKGVPAFYDQHHLTFEFATETGYAIRRKYGDFLRQVLDIDARDSNAGAAQVSKPIEMNREALCEVGARVDKSLRIEPMTETAACLQIEDRASVFAVSLESGAEIYLPVVSDAGVPLVAKDWHTAFVMKNAGDHPLCLAARYSAPSDAANSFWLRLPESTGYDVENIWHVPVSADAAAISVFTKFSIPPGAVIPAQVFPRERGASYSELMLTKCVD